MPAKSQAQRRLFGIARGIQKGEVSPSLSSKAEKIARTTSVSDVKDFAKTKEKGLPFHKRLAQRKIKTPRKLRG